MFEKATRIKLRFNCRGLCSTEDLWDLSVKELDEIFKDLNKKVKEQEGESLLKEKTSSDEILYLKISIVKHIVKTKLKEQNLRKNKALEAARKQKILGIIAEKQDAELQSKDIETLNKMIE